MYEKPIHSLGSCPENLPIDMDCISLICQFNKFFGINARECFHPAAPYRGIENWKIYVIDQIKSYAECREMVPKASVSL